MSSKRIIFFIYDLGIGGAEKVVVNLCKYLNRKSNQTEILVINDDNKELTQELDSATKVTSFSIIRIYKSLTKLYKYLSNRKYDFFIANVWPLTVISVCLTFIFPNLKEKLILIEHGVLHQEFKSKGKIFLFLQKLSIKFFYNRSKKVIAVSEGVKKDLVLKGVLEDKIKVIYNPVETNKDIEKESLVRLGNENSIKKWEEGDHERVISIGNLRSIKDYPTLIDAVDRLVNEGNVKLKLLIVGEGPERDSISEKIKLRGLSEHIFLAGSVYPPFLLLKKSDMFVISSIVESFGLVVVEALSEGLTVVTTDTDGPREIIEDGKFGYISKIGDSKDLSEKIYLGLSNKLDPLKQKKRSELYSIDKIGKDYESLLS